jgi:hypothetical protein
MDVPLESLHNKVTIFSVKYLKRQPSWWYGIKLDASDPDSMAQLCGINNIELETGDFVQCLWLYLVADRTDYYAASESLLM